MVNMELNGYAMVHVLVIPQYEYNILVITQVRGEVEDAGDNKDIV